MKLSGKMGMKRFVGVLGYLGQSRVCFSWKISRYENRKSLKSQNLEWQIGDETLCWSSRKSRTIKDLCVAALMMTHSLPVLLLFHSPFFHFIDYMDVSYQSTNSPDSTFSYLFFMSQFWRNIWLYRVKHVAVFFSIMKNQ